MYMRKEEKPIKDEELNNPERGGMSWNSSFQ
jgi:hypothetical protein